MLYNCKELHFTSVKCVLSIVLSSHSFDDEDDNPIEDDTEDPGRPWPSSDNPSPPQTTSGSGTVSPDSVCFSSCTVGGDHTATLDSGAACYGEAVWVGENGFTGNSSEELTDERVSTTSSSDRTVSSGVQHSLIRTSPLVSKTNHPRTESSPVQASDLCNKRPMTFHGTQRAPCSDQTSPSSGFSEGLTEINPSGVLPFRSSNRFLTHKSVNSSLHETSAYGRALPSAFQQSSLLSRSRFTASHLGSGDWRHSVHGRNCGKMLRCEACGKYYRNEYSLDHHICLKRKDVWKKGDVPSKIIDGQVVYFCPTCHKPFKWLGNLTRHYYVHTGQRFFKCDICPKEFFSAYQVRRHMNSHTGVRFKCEVCEKPFTCKYACAWHTRQHYTYVE
ncbi:Zinc finger protein [Fasciolopsis buskii]|uniref:Zinc finger protein n=1 Tax=Fasciolopsis buskii TaxID=27845 RepID=A0A8E0RSK2_9TREM|nr:Zinc finger protein [Fasciolopsis buski]